MRSLKWTEYFRYIISPPINIVDSTHALLFISRNRRPLSMKCLVAMTNNGFEIVGVYFESTSNADHVDKYSSQKIKLRTAREKKNCVKNV